MSADHLYDLQLAGWLLLCAISAAMLAGVAI